MFSVSFVYEPFKVEVERPTFIETTDLDQLLKEKKDLEQESHRLDEQIKDLDMRARTFCERVIQEFQKNNQKKQQSVNQLRERIETMEKRLGLENAIHETNLENDKKQHDVNQLRELIGELDSQFEEIALSNDSAEYRTKKVNDCNDAPPSEPTQKRRLDVNA